MTDRITFLEELQYNAFPALQTLLYDGWTLRFGGNFTYRVNCANPVYPGSLPPEEKLDHVEKTYADSGLDACILKLHEGVSDAGTLDTLLSERGYAEERRGNIFLCDLKDFCHTGRSEVLVDSAVEGEWLRDFLDMNGTTRPAVRAAAEKMLQNIAVPVLAASVRLDGKTVACGLGVCERGYVGLYDIYVDTAYRRRGLGADLCAGIMSVGRELGCDTAYLQVLSDNAPARTLYRSLGYREDYEYWFRVRRF